MLSDSDLSVRSSIQDAIERIEENHPPPPPRRPVAPSSPRPERVPTPDGLLLL